MKTLILTMIMVFTTSFQSQRELEWVADFSIFRDENGQFVVYYKGQVDQCVSKKIIDFMYRDCDSIKYNIPIDSTSIEPDSCKIPVKKIKGLKWI